MLKRLFEKDEVWFAVVWIIIYVVGFANADAISKSLGCPKLLTVFVGLILSVIIYRFICKKQLKDYYGLCGLKAEYKNYLYFIPLILILPYFFGVFGVQVCQPVADICAFALSVPIGLGELKLIKQMEKGEEYV